MNFEKNNIWNSQFEKEQNKLNSILKKIDILMESNINEVGEQSYLKTQARPELDNIINDFLSKGDINGLTSFIIEKKGNEYKYLIDKLVDIYKNPTNENQKQALKNAIQISLDKGEFANYLTSNILRKIIGVDMSKGGDDYNTAKDIVSQVINGQLTSKYKGLKNIPKMDYALDKYDTNQNRSFTSFIGNPFGSALYMAAKRAVETNLKGKSSVSTSGERDGEGSNVPTSSSMEKPELDDFQYGQALKLGLDEEMIEQFLDFYIYKETPSEVREFYDNQGENGAYFEKIYQKFIEIMKLKSSKEQEIQKVKKYFIEFLIKKEKKNLADFFVHELQIRSSSPSSQVKKQLLPDIKTFKEFGLTNYIKRVLLQVVIKSYFDKNDMDFNSLKNSLSFSGGGNPWVTGIKNEEELNSIIDELKSKGASDIINNIEIILNIDDTNKYDGESLDDLFGGSLAQTIRTKVHNSIDGNLKDSFELQFKPMLSAFGLDKNYEFKEMFQNTQTARGWKKPKLEKGELEEYSLISEEYELMMEDEETFEDWIKNYPL